MVPSPLALIALALAAPPGAGIVPETSSDEVLVIPQYDLPKMWKRVHEAQLRFDTARLREHGYACVSLGYVIEPDGRASTIRVVKSRPQGVFDEAAIEALSKIRFEPGPANEARAPVYSIMSYTASWRSSGNAEEDHERVLAKCAVLILPPDAGTGMPIR
jgi:TonB family protein